ncbi:FAD/NAD(P)-binding domain-containing protein [Dendrothele bispora CBS 962.96]|uniref:FAD/NAD(P)-binding domain-containing protein n=1 Tax=Dendrothele bispora (strain CBS 962.96) TaxID=1314807 RepID=A0A4S8MWT0_DENBC|nr:FAD/NAD(P)-binding domain-containing protein [Dendrothele bispora CBS 962.96]
MAKPIFSTAPIHICIVGAGPCGLAALQVISDTPEFKSGRWVPTVFEARETVGGIWNPVPAGHQNEPPKSPLYDSMTTNIPHPVMAYTTFPFPPLTPLFPPASSVQRYLQAYASHFNLLPYVRLNTAVKEATWDESKCVWKVTVLGGLSVITETHLFDHLIVANGHFHKPRYPEIPGLPAWLESGRILHSAWYRRPSDTGNAKKVVVIGNGPSGMDIAAELVKSGRTVLHSVGNNSPAVPQSLPEQRGRTTGFGDLVSGTMFFEDGTVDQDIDKVILATGYEYSIPFLPSVIAESTLSAGEGCFNGSKIQNSSYHLYPLAQDIFPLIDSIPPSRLAFMGLLLRGTPFTLFEAQAHTIVKVFRQPSSLDFEREKTKILAKHKQLCGEGMWLSVDLAKDWHRPTEPESFVYRDGLNEFAGVKYRVPEWEKDMWKWKIELRSEWRKLEENGESEQLVNGVGSNSREGWVKLMYDVLERAGVTIQRG